MFRLTDEQANVLRAVSTGHNAVITGQAGTGKSHLVREIFTNLKRRGKKVAIICSSGIAGTVYADLCTSIPTVHSFYGLRTADLPWNLVVDRATSDNLLRERVKEVDCIVWDEVSMSSRRIFELANYLHWTLSTTPDSPKPLSGKQIILVGDFLQLRPVPNFFDDGSYVFESPVFDRAIPHRYELTTIVRQDESDREFIQCLRDVRMGRCSEQSRAFLTGLARNLPEELENQATHIFFRKLSVQVFNMRVLLSLPGNTMLFDAVDAGDTRGIQCPAEPRLALKEGCRVMLVWNKSDKLRNGSAGIFLGKQEGDSILVEFEGVGQIRLKGEVWQKRAISGEIVGTRTQYPIVLMYAITSHKSQGLTLPAVVLHCSKEFVPGLVYVALTRVRKAEHLQVLDFSTYQLLSPDERCIDVCSHHQDIGTVGFSCCRDKVLSKNEVSVTDNLPDECPVSQPDEGITETLDSEVTAERLVLSYYERGEPDEHVIDLVTAQCILSDETLNEFAKTPPETFDISRLLKTMQVQEPLSNYAISKNEVLADLLNMHHQTNYLQRFCGAEPAKLSLKIVS